MPQPNELETALNTYAKDAQNAYGIVDDAVFTEAFTDTSIRHDTEANISAILGYLCHFETGNPGTFSHGSDKHKRPLEQLQWHHSFHAPQELADRTTLGVDVFVTTTVGRRFEKSGDSDSWLDPFRAVGALVDKTGTDESILGIDRVLSGVGLRGRTFEYPGLHTKLAGLILGEPSRLSMSIAAQAHLPEAPVEILPLNIDLSFTSAMRMVRRMEPNQAGIAQARRDIAEAGAVTTDTNIATYYAHRFGFAVDETWVDTIPGLGTSNEKLAAFRSGCQRVVALLQQVNALGNQIKQSDVPDALQKHHADILNYKHTDL